MYSFYLTIQEDLAFSSPLIQTAGFNANLNTAVTNAQGELVLAGTSTQATLPLVNEIDTYSAVQDAYFMVLTPPPPFTTGVVTSGMVTSGPMTSGLVTSASVTTIPVTTSPLTSGIVTTSISVTTQQLSAQGMVTTSLVTTFQSPTATSDSQNSENPSIEEGKGNLKGNMTAIIGGVVGGFLFLILIVLVIVIVTFKRKRQIKRPLSQNDLELKGYLNFIDRDSQDLPILK